MPLIWLAALAQSHLLLIVQKGSIFERPRNWLADRGRWLRQLLSCTLCLGFWVAVSLALALHLSWCEMLAVAGLGHLITLVREKFLPCTACESDGYEASAFTIH